jgi:NAD(P)-dependent dehydrogenase (short-subunit alcohol dehydrogenase family)
MAIQFDFTGKGVIVTHSATGLGRRIAEAFHELGATVAIHDASVQEVTRALTELGGDARYIGASGDLSKPADVAQIIQKAVAGLGRLDVLVCCATKARLCPIDHITAAELNHVVGASTKQAFFATQACVPALRATRGSVVHVASTIGLVGGPPGAVAYATASGATVQMTRMMALELAPDGIRVNVVCPAWAEADDPAVSAVLGDYFKSRSPVGRMTTPDECAAAVLYLAAPLSGSMAGASLVPDTGIASGHYVG